FTIEENLSGISGRDQFFCRRIKKRVFEKQFGCSAVDVSGFEDDVMAISQDAFIIALNIDDGDNNIATEQIQISETIFFAKSFAPIFEIAYKMTMPNDA